MASAIIAKGSAVISINSQETEARLVFHPNPGADGWDIAAINKLAADSQLSPLSDQKLLETFLAKAAKAKTREAMEMVYARGIEPEDATGEEITWEPLPLPADMAPHKEKTLHKAPAPEIFRITVEKIKHETKVKKSGALPFIGAKEEIAVSWEKKEKREKVDINPEVLEIKYTLKETKIGTIHNAFPGKPGKNIFGRPIHPKPAPDSSCLLGKGIMREKNELFAEISGFVRIGDTWADMVPFAKHAYNISQSVDGLTLFLNFEPGDPCFTVPRGEEILADALARGAVETGLISAKELDDAIAAAVASGENLQAYSLFRTQEAEARVDINQDKTSATLYLRKGVAGALPLEMKTISHVIKESEVKGFDTETLKTAITEFMQGHELEFTYLLAEGVPSSRGRDREVELLTHFLSPEEQKKLINCVGEWRRHNALQKEGIDLKTVTGVVFVDKGSNIARVSAESEGEAGKDIYGNVIPGLPGNDPDIKLFGGLDLHGSGIVASRDGLLLMEASEKNFRGEVIQYQDAKIGLHISSDGMEAKGDFFREEGAGLPLTVDNIKKTLASIGVVKGINWINVEKACFHARLHGSILGCVLARGLVPVAKGSSAVKWLVPLVSHLADDASAGNASAGDASSDVFTDTSDDDTSSKGEVVQIKAGAPIVELSDPYPDGRAGYDVRGTEIPIEQGTALTIEHDDSVSEIPLQKGKRLVAARSGDLSFDGKTLTINSMKTISGDVTPDTGNIKFSGEIQINGNVLPGCVVIGGSHVTVDGLAERAIISAGGKAVTVKGFKGDGKGILRARAGIDSAFVERASVMAIGDIHLIKGSILSSIKTNGKLFVVADDGKLSGGVCQARYGIDCADIGSEKGVRTELSFGQDYMIKDEINECEEKLSKVKQSLSSIEHKITDCLNNKLPLPDNLKKEKMRFVKLQEQFHIKLFTLQEKFEEHFESEIHIRGTIFPGVVIESHNRYYEVKKKRSQVIFYFDRESGRILEKPIT